MGQCKYYSHRAGCSPSHGWEKSRVQAAGPLTMKAQVRAMKRMGRQRMLVIEPADVESGTAPIIDRGGAW